MGGLLTDLRSAWRLMGRHRGTSALIMLTLALGLGANVAIVAVARGVLLRPLPYEDPDNLLMVWTQRGPLQAGQTGRGYASPRWFREIRARNRAFASIDAIELWNGNPSATFDLPSTTAPNGCAARL
jgi:putative ABC transport system permease protein